MYSLVDCGYYIIFKDRFFFVQLNNNDNKTRSNCHCQPTIKLQSLIGCFYVRNISHIL